MTVPDDVRALKLAMIGSLPPPIGGTTVSFRALCEFVEARVARCEVIDTGRRSGGNAGAALRAVRSLLTAIGRCDVVTMHFSDRAAVTIGPILAKICLVSGKPFIFRQFGGEFDRTVAGLPGWHRTVLRNTIFRADRVLLQTKGMMRNLADLASEAVWFPTARTPSGMRNDLAFANRRRDRLRCLFMGHVSRAKGALLAAEAVARVENAELSIYGSLVDITPASLDVPGTTYHGIADPAEVSRIMASHDLLLFPSMHPGEGYSGTLIEAAMVGLPIVASRWQSLPEMFSDEEVLFVTPGRLEPLVEAIRHFADAPAEALHRSERLIARTSDFDSGTLFAGFLDHCADVASGKGANYVRHSG